MTKPLTNKVAFVTGGSRGIGAAIVKRLARDGATVAFTYLNAKEKADRLVADIQTDGGKAIAIHADSGNDNSITTAIQQTTRTLGQLDILVNNAGVFVTGTIDDQTSDLSAFERQYNINVKGVVAGVRAAVPLLKESGRIISIGSVVANSVPMAGLGDYAATKAALAAYTRAWSRDLGPRNITVNTVQPGPIDTDMNPANSDFAAQLNQMSPLGRYGKPDDIAAAVAFLASPDANYITGTTLNVDGGLLT